MSKGAGQGGNGTDDCAANKVPVDKPEQLSTLEPETEFKCGRCIGSFESTVRVSPLATKLQGGNLTGIDDNFAECCTG